MGKRVALSYDQHVGIPSTCFGETGYFCQQDPRRRICSPAAARRQRGYESPHAPHPADGAVRGARHRRSPSIDTYLPALHAIGTRSGVSTAATQQTLTAYMLPMALMVLWHGALSDAFGRKREIVVDACRRRLGGLRVCRQPAHAAGRPRAAGHQRRLRGWSSAARWCGDLHDGPAAQRLMSHVSMAFALGPAIAPIWRMDLQRFRLACHLRLLACSAFRAGRRHRLAPAGIPPPARPSPAASGAAGLALPRSVLNPGFLLLTFAVGFNFNGFFVYVLSAPVFLIHHLGLPETGFGWFFIPTVSGHDGRLGRCRRGSPASCRPGGTIALGFALMLGAVVGQPGRLALLPPGLPQSVLPIML